MTWHDAALVAPTRLRAWLERFVRAHLVAPHPPLLAPRVRLVAGGVLQTAFRPCVGECRDCGGFTMRHRALDVCYFCGGRRWLIPETQTKGAA